MAMPVDDPAATAVIEWIRPEAGGNRTGPPDWPVAVEIVFPWEAMRYYHPEHIDMNWGTTVIIDPIDLITAYIWESKLDFIARRAVLPLLEADRQVAIHRGGRQIVAVSRIKEILGPASASQSSPLPRPGQPPPSHRPIRPGRSSPRPRSIGSPRRPGVSTIRPRPAPSQSSPPSSAAASGRRPGT